MRAVNCALATSLAFAFTAGIAPSSLAATYMKIGDIRGDVTEQSHRNWIELDSFSWGTTRGRAQVTAGNPPSQNGPGTITVTKRADSSSAGLMRACSDGAFFDEVEIHWSDAAPGATSESYFQYVLTDALITGCEPAGAVPTETFSLTYTEIEWRPARVQPRPRIQR